MSRIAATNSDGSTKSREVRDGRLIDERRHVERLQRSLGELRIRFRCRLQRSAW
jgi:hypothetical protein